MEFETPRGAALLPDEEVHANLIDLGHIERRLGTNDDMLTVVQDVRPRTYANLEDATFGRESMSSSA